MISWILIYKSQLIDRKRKFVQVLFSFCLPFLGPLIVGAVHLSDILKPESKEEREFTERGTETNKESTWTTGESP